MWSVEKHLTVS